MKNLKAEIARFDIKISDLQRVLNCSERTVRNKLNGSSALTYPEAKKIKDAFFPECPMEYLFDDEPSEAS